MFSGQQGSKELIDKLTANRDNFIAFPNRQWPLFLNTRTLLNLEEEEAFLLRRPSKHSQKIKYALIVNQPLIGNGACGFICPILGTIVINQLEGQSEKQLEIKTQKPQVVKISNGGIEFDAELVAKHEYRYANGYAKNLHVKPPVICTIKNIIFSFLVMDYIQGKDVMDCLIDNIHLTTTALLLQAALQLVNIVIHLNEQQVVHCDLKPENFIWGKGRKDKEAQIYLIDWAMACRSDKIKKGKISGTLDYIDPAVHEKTMMGSPIYYETYHDQFSVFRTLVVMLCNPIADYGNYERHLKISLYIKLPRYAQYVHDNLKLKDLGLETTEHQLLENSLKAGLALQKEDRISLNTFQKDLERIANRHLPPVSPSPSPSPSPSKEEKPSQEKITKIENYLQRFFTLTPEVKTALTATAEKSLKLA